MPLNYPLKSDHVENSRNHISFFGASPDNYRITRISTENGFHRIVHSTSKVGKDLLRCSSPTLYLKQDDLLQKKKNLPIKEKIQLSIYVQLPYIRLLHSQWMKLLLCSRTKFTHSAEPKVSHMLGIWITIRLITKVKLSPEVQLCLWFLISLSLLPFASSMVIFIL